MAISRLYKSGRWYLQIFPHGYKAPISLPVKPDDPDAWTWNGSTEAPTLRPSIKTTHSNGTISHLWLTGGICKHLQDSTDGMAGKTLPLQSLPEWATEPNNGADE